MNKRRRHHAKRRRRLNRLADISHACATWEWRTVQRFFVQEPQS